VTGYAPRKGDSFRARSRVIWDRTSQGGGPSSGKKTKIRTNPPIPKDAKLDWDVIAIRVFPPGQDPVILPCREKGWKRSSPELHALVRDLHDKYPGSRIETTT